MERGELPGRAIWAPGQMERLRHAIPAQIPANVPSRAHRFLDLHSFHHDDDDDGGDDGPAPPGYARHPLLRELTAGRPWA